MTQVCMLATSFPRFDGDYAGTFVFQTALGLVRQGISVTVVAPGSAGSPKQETMDGIQVLRFAYWWPLRHQAVAYGDGIPANLRRPVTWIQIPSFMLCFLSAALRTAQSHDLIHVHWLPLACVGYLSKKIFHIPLAVTTHGSDIRMVPAAITRLLLGLADAVLATTSELEMLLRELGCPAIHRVPLPIDDTKFNPQVDATPTRRELDIGEQEPVVAFIGRLDSFKDPLTLVEAAPKVLARRPDVAFLIVGDGPLMPDAQRRVVELGLGNQVRLTGVRPDIPEILKLTTLFLALSPVENVWSTTIGEAMSVGIPCIITAAGQSAHFFSNQANCYLVPPKDPNSLAAAILHLVDDATLRQKLIAGGRKLLEDHDRTMRNATARLLKVYELLLNTKQ